MCCNSYAAKHARNYWRRVAKHSVSKRLRRIPCLGPLRVALLLVWMQTAHSFRSKRQLWSYSGFAGLDVQKSCTGKHREEFFLDIPFIERLKPCPVTFKG